MKKIDRQKLCELFSRLDHLCNSVSIFKDTRVSYCDKKFKSFIESDNKKVFLDGLHSVISTISQLPIKQKSNKAIKNSSSKKTGNKIDYELTKFAIVSRNSFTVCLFASDIDLLTFDDIKEWLPDSNKSDEFHPYSKSIIDKLLEEKIVPLFSQVPIVNTDHRIVSAIDLIGINMKTLTPVVIEVKTGFDSRVYGQGTYYLHNRYGSDIKMCQKTGHLLQLFYYSKWLRDQGFDTMCKDYVIVANRYANNGVDKWFSIPRQWREEHISDNIYSAFGNREYIVNKQKTDRNGQNQCISKIFQKSSSSSEKKIGPRKIYDYKKNDRK